LLGPLKDVMQTGANDVYVVDGKEKEILIPSIKQCILNVDLEKGEILVHLLEGLLDL
jgi:16S rRNA processing protein RimM